MLETIIALGFLIACAILVVTLAAFRFRKSLLKGKDEVSLTSDDALAMPFGGSVVLFMMYVLLRFIPKEYFSAIISAYVCTLSVFALAGLMREYIKPNILTGLFCLATSFASWYYSNWIANDLLAISMGVMTLESMRLDTFSTSYLLLIGLFFYDIFWVFGSDVMLTVATGIDGPIKLLFPRNIFGDHTNKTLLGLGDLIVPGFFIVQTLVFSQDYAKRGYLYFGVAVAAYFLSLVNTMIVMVVFQHGQPALLFIVPWLLISFTLTALWKGDFKMVWSYDASSIVAKEAVDGGAENVPAAMKEDSVAKFVCNSLLNLFGLVKDDEEAEKKTINSKIKTS